MKDDEEVGCKEINDGYQKQQKGEGDKSSDLLLTDAVLKVSSWTASRPSCFNGTIEISFSVG